MTPAHTQLARRRLWLGITNVGFWVLAAAAGLFWRATSAAPSDGATRYLLLGSAAVAAQGIFDVIGGALLMPPPRPAVGVFARTWSRGVLGHTLVLGAVGLLGGISFRLTGGFCPGVLAAMAGLAFSRRWLLHGIAGVTAGESVQAGTGMILAADPHDPAFTGGITGLGKRAVSLFPANWLRDLPSSEVAAETSRRQWQIARGLPSRTFFLLLLWNLVGTSVGEVLLETSAHPLAPALFAHACWMTLWTFGGLLVLPILSRRAVFAADRAAVEAGLAPRGARPRVVWACCRPTGYRAPYNRKTERLTQASGPLPDRVWPLTPAQKLHQAPADSAAQDGYHPGGGSVKE